MGADLSEEPRQGIIAQIMDNLRAGINELQWREVVLFGVSAGVLMSLSFIQGQSNFLSIIAGIIPVGTGLLLGRRVKGHYGLHGFATGLIGALVGLLLEAALIFLTPFGANAVAQANATGLTLTLADIYLQIGGLTAFSLVAFCTFGASTTGRAEQRNRQAREVVEARGGRLERPSAIRTADDIRGLSLPQFGSYVSNLFKKKGFQLKEYKFIDKDKHLDLWMEYEGEPWHLRLTVADKVNPGTIESLSQEMKREGYRKGVVLTSTEFAAGALKSAKGRPIVLIDGQTLYEIAEK